MNIFTERLDKLELDLSTNKIKTSNIEKDLEEIKESLNFQEELTKQKIAEINKRTESEIKHLYEQKRFESIKETNAIKNISEKLVDLENQSQRNNLRIEGVNELLGETWNDSMKILLKKQLKREKDSGVKRRKCCACTSDTSTSDEEDGIVSVGNVHYDEKYIDNENDDGQDGDVNDRTKETAIDYSDCGLWPIHRNIQFVDYVINIGAIQVNLDTYPRDNRRRHFSNAYYNRKLSNGEVISRRWLVYSVSKDAVFCFCCKLFDFNMNLKLNGNGFNKWKNSTEALKIYENGKSHRIAYRLWIETEIRMKAGETIDKQEQKLIEKGSLR
nr:zinc finger MYM-type protein 5-like [Hydra vulgaris]